MSDPPTSPPWLPGADVPPPRPVLTPQLIVETAHRLVHQGGADALSLRALARELGVGTTAVYGRIKKKEHLLLAVVDAVLSEVRIPDASLEWRAGLRKLSEEVHDVLLAHPHVHPVIDSVIIVTPRALAIADAALGYLGRAGFEGDALVHTYNAWVGYVMGFSILETKPAPEDSERRAFAAQVHDYLDGLEADTYPNLVANLQHLANRAYSVRWESAPLGGGASFGYGLDLLLEGFAERVSPGSPGGAPDASVGG